jgi:DNA-binding transcriptional MerR regulator
VQISELISATQQALRELPEKKYFTMGEVEAFTHVAAHQLRYWEKEVSQLAPSKRLGRRYYQPADIEKILFIKALMAEGLGLKESSQALKQIDKAKRLHKLPEQALADEQGDLFSEPSQGAVRPAERQDESQQATPVMAESPTAVMPEDSPSNAGAQEPRKITLPSTRIQQLLQEAKRLRALA